MRITSFELFASYIAGIEEGETRILENLKITKLYRKQNRISGVLEFGIWTLKYNSKKELEKIFRKHQNTIIRSINKQEVLNKYRRMNNRYYNIAGK